MTFTQALDRFIKDISHLWQDEPLDGDETEDIAAVVHARLDMENGNITPMEYYEEVQSLIDEIEELWREI